MLMPSIFGENLFNDDWMNFGFPEVEKALYGKHASHEMKTDEINIQLDNGYLSISAAKGLDKDEQDKEGKYIRKERYAGSMSRSFYVGNAITQDDIKAKYESGILRLSVPKKAAEEIESAKRIAIEG